METRVAARLNRSSYDWAASSALAWRWKNHDRDPFFMPFSSNELDRRDSLASYLFILPDRGLYFFTESLEYGHVLFARHHLTSLTSACRIDRGSSIPIAGMSVKID